jgi:hypothetical protein
MGKRRKRLSRLKVLFKPSATADNELKSGAAFRTPRLAADRLT